MYQRDSRPQDPDADAAMTALYRELDRRDLPSDPVFDTEAGLLDLIGRMQRHTSRGPEPGLIGRHKRVSAYAGIATEPSRDLEAEIELTRLTYSHELELAARSSRTKTFFFAGISAMAVAATVLVTVPHLASFAAVIAIAVSNATAAAAGTVVCRTGTLVRRTGDAARRRARAGTDPAGPGGHSPAPGTGTGDAVLADLPGSLTRVHIEQFSGTLALAESQRLPAGPPGQIGRRAVSAVLAVLIAATAAGAAIGIVGMLNRGLPIGYEVALMTPTATSILLLITTWWWRATDHSAPTPPSAAITRDACVALLRAAVEVRTLAESWRSYRGDADGVRARVEELRNRAGMTAVHAAEVGMLVPMLSGAAERVGEAAGDVAVEVVANTDLSGGVVLGGPDVSRLVASIDDFRYAAVRHAAD
jgi:hypothetical protein